MNAEVYIGEESVGTLAGTTLVLMPPWSALAVANSTLRLRLENVPEIEAVVKCWDSATQTKVGVVIEGVRLTTTSVEEATTFISKAQLKSMAFDSLKVIAYAINQPLNELNINTKSEITQTDDGVTVRVQKWSVKL